MELGKKRVRTYVKVIFAVTIPLFVVVLAFCGLGVYLYYHIGDEILPGVFIDNVDVSWLTREEAAQAIDLHAYDTRGMCSEVDIAYPDGSELKITGEDVRFVNDAQFLIDVAFAKGRGNGFIMDTLGFLQRMYNLYIMDANPESYTISFDLDIEFLRAHINVFTEKYNSALEGSVPLIYDDRVVIVKGAGQVSAEAFVVYDMALEGLHESLASGCPVILTYALPEVNVNKTELVAIHQTIFEQPLSAEYDPETKTISDSVIGADLDLSDAIGLLDEAESGETVSIDIEYTQPEVTREDLENTIFHDLIGECVTNIAGSENRLNNIILASGAINGFVLESGEEFSFNRVVGKRTSSRGYKSAPAFSGGQTVQMIGGGICQVSSTIYSAIKDTDLKIKERHPHGQPVTYLPRGRDATVSWGTLDFRLVNNTEYPLRIDIGIEDRVLTVQVFGTVSPLLVGTFS